MRESPAWSPHSTAPGQAPGAGMPSGYTPKPPTGSAAWLAGLALYFPIPIVNYLAFLVVALIMRSKTSKQTPLAAANGRAALNWCLTYGLLWLLWGVVFAAEILTHVDFQTGVATHGFLGKGGFLCLYLLIVPLLGGGILALVNIIGGSTTASRGRLFRGWLTIPFLRVAAVHAEPTTTLSRA